MWHGQTLISLTSSRRHQIAGGIPYDNSVTGEAAGTSTTFGHIEHAGSDH